MRNRAVEAIAKNVIPEEANAKGAAGGGGWWRNSR